MGEIQHLEAKIEPGKFTFERGQQFHASSKETARTCTREKKTKYFTVQWQYLMTFD